MTTSGTSWPLCRRHRRAIPAALTLGLSLLALAARASTRVCLAVEAKADEIADLRALVADELAHHPTHRLVERDCASRIQVRLFVVDGVRYLTVRVGRQVPVRHVFVDRKELGQKLSKALALVLERDPVYLQRDITRYSGLQRMLHSILKRGHNRIRLEFFELLGTDGEELLTLPGGAISLHRGADHWQVLARIYFGGSPADAADGRLLKLYGGGEVGLAYETSARSNRSFYLAATAGAQLLHYEGRLRAGDPDSLDSASVVGATLGLRAGLRLFRAYDFDCDLFVAGHLPLFKTHDPDSPLIDSYTPSLLLGMGVGF